MLAESNPVRIRAIQAVLAAFKASENGKWAHVEINFDAAPVQQLYQKTVASVAAGATWDLLQADGPLIKHYAYSKAIRPMGEYYTADDLKQWVDPSVEEGSYQGILYAPPMMQSASLMFYNADLVKKHGINPPQDLSQSWTMEEAMEIWTRTTEREDPAAPPTVWGIWPAQGSRSDFIGGIFRRGAGKKDSPAFAGIGDDGVTMSGYFDAPDAVKGLAFYQSLNTKMVSPVQPIPNIFNTGKAVFTIGPDSVIGAIQNEFPNGGFNFGVTGIPRFADGTHMTQTGSWHWGVSPNTKFLEETVAFVKFAAGKTGSRELWNIFQQIPAHRELLTELPAYQTYPQKMFIEALTTIGVPRIQSPGYQEFQTLCTEANTNIAGGANVQETLSSTAKKMDVAMAKYKGWKK